MPREDGPSAAAALLTRAERLRRIRLVARIHASSPAPRALSLPEGDASVDLELDPLAFDDEGAPDA